MLRLIGMLMIAGVLGINSPILGAVSEGILFFNLADSTDHAPRFRFDGNTFSLINDGIAGTSGARNAAITYAVFLNDIPDIPTRIASVDLEGLSIDGPAVLTYNGSIRQFFKGGTVRVYDPGNVLLLSADLNSNSLAGIPSPNMQALLLTIEIGPITGGTLAPLLDANSLYLAVRLDHFSGPLGISMTGDALDPFTASGSFRLLAAPFVPEPAMSLSGLMLVVMIFYTRRAGVPVSPH